MTYRPRYRKMNKHLEHQIAKQEERIQTAGYNAYMFYIGAFHDDVMCTSTFYSNKFKE